MTGPTPNDMPLFEGLDPSWNDVLSVLPEDKRSEYGQKIAERTKLPDEYSRWENFNKSGITPEQAEYAIGINKLIEDRPMEVYKAIAEHLNIPVAEAKQVVDEIDEGDEDDNPELSALKQQVDVMQKILLTKHNQETQAQQQAAQDAELEKELSGLRKKFGDDVNEDQVLMRMYTKGITAEEAHQQYMSEVAEIMKRRPSPMVLSGGGVVPNKPLDPTKLNPQDTKKLVAQMMQQGIEA